MNYKSLFFLIFSIAMATVMTWINSSWLSYQGLVTKNNEKQVDYYLSDFTLLKTSATGEMRYFLKGQHLVHKNATGGSKIFQPIIQAQDSDGKNIFIQANRATQKKSLGQIELSGKVLLKKTDTPTTAKTDPSDTGFTLKTNQLSFNPLERILFTNAPLTLTTKNTLLTGSGLYSKLDEQEIEIKNVHTTFNPTP